MKVEWKKVTEDDPKPGAQVWFYVPSGYGGVFRGWVRDGYFYSQRPFDRSQVSHFALFEYPDPPEDGE